MQKTVSAQKSKLLEQKGNQPDSQSMSRTVQRMGCIGKSWAGWGACNQGYMMK